MRHLLMAHQQESFLPFSSRQSLSCCLSRVARRSTPKPRGPLYSPSEPCGPFPISEPRGSLSFYFSEPRGSFSFYFHKPKSCLFIPSQGIYLDCRFSVRVHRRGNQRPFHCHVCLSLSPLLLPFLSLSLKAMEK